MPAKSWLASVAALLAGALALGTASAVEFDRGALWKVVQACVADARLTGLPYPCLAVDLAGGEERGHVLLRPPWANDLIVSPTRAVVGVEDPLLQSVAAPNDFAAAWRARTMIATANGRQPSRDQVALVANSRPARAQDQLHIHVGCLRLGAKRVLADAAHTLPLDAWRPIGWVVPHQSFWAMRIRGADLEGVNPFRLVHDLIDPMVRDPADVTVVVAGAKVGGEDDFLLLASYAWAPGALWPARAEDLIDRRCWGEAVAS